MMWGWDGSRKEVQTSHVLQSIRAKFGISGIPVATGKMYYQVFVLKKTP